MSRKANPAVVGAFVVAGLALLVAGIVVFSSVQLFDHTHRVVVYFGQSVHGLRIGSPVKFKGIEVGAVREISINLTMLRQRPDNVRIPVILELDQEKLSAEGATIDLADPETVPSLVRDGLRAELALDSLLTGIRYIALDMKPGTRADLVADPAVDYPEIPTLPTRAEEIEQKMSEVVAQFARADIEGLFRSAKELTDGATAIVTAPELQRAVQRLDGLTANLDAAVLELRRTAHELGPGGETGSSLASASKNAEALTAEGSETAVALRQLLHPDGAFLTDLEATLAEIHDAARSLRQASDQLSRDPGSVLRGGEQ